MQYRSVYKGLQIRILVVPKTADSFDAQIAIVSCEGKRMRWQRFLDVADLRSEDECTRLGLVIAHEWIDDQPARDRSEFVRSGFSALGLSSAH